MAAKDVPGSAHLPLTLGGLTASGGIFAFVKSRSAISLGGGLGLGALFMFSAYKIKQGDHFKGHCYAGATSAALAVTMGTRWHTTGKLMPGAPLAGLGLVGLAYSVKQAVDWYDGE